jgi:sulfide:quinone oxidoreductase
MQIKSLTPTLSVSSQVEPADIPAITAAGYKTIICNRPDGEGDNQPRFSEVEAAAASAGLQVGYLPVAPGQPSDEQAAAFGRLLEALPQPALAYCRTGMRSASLWALSRDAGTQPDKILARAAGCGYDLGALAPRLGKRSHGSAANEHWHQIVIVGAGAAGIAVASSLLVRDASLDIVIVDPAGSHYYQPGWTLVGAGVFDAPRTRRPTGALIPHGVRWIQSAVSRFEPQFNTVILEDGRRLVYQALVVCPGLKLDWGAIEGLENTLGTNGVTSNYRYDLAPYTWELVQRFKGGTALFTQPPMPIKCAGAPQKAMYLSCDTWRQRGVLGHADVQFRSAGATLFGVADYVPALMEYVRRYGIDLHFGQRLTAVDGARRIATFSVATPDGERIEEVAFDMLHVVPPQTAPDFIRKSLLADSSGWLDVDHATLRSKRFHNVFGLGDAAGTPNAKTAAAARKQAPVVAHNLLFDLGLREDEAHYDGYGSCPLTVERGKIVLAEFTYGGKLAPSFPDWLLDGRKPSRLAWLLKERILPPLYWHGMLKGREWMAQPETND